MSSWKTGLAIVGLAFTPLAVVAYTHGADVLTPASAGAVKGTEGSRRDVILAGLTEDYVAAGHPASAAMRQGRQLAPATFLNLRLAALGLSWRVTSSDGGAAETYDIS